MNATVDTYSPEAPAVTTGTFTSSPAQALISVGGHTGSAGGSTDEPDRETRIDRCFKQMVAARTKPERTAFWLTMLELIESRPEEEKQRLDAARLERARR